MCHSTSNGKKKYSKKFLGNELDIVLDRNEYNLIVIGSRCRITIGKNIGSVQIIGDYCEVNVTEGEGGIKYIGNYGKIDLGETIPENLVSYTGNGGNIKQGSEQIRPYDKSAPSLKSRSNIIQIENSQHIRVRFT